MLARIVIIFILTCLLASVANAQTTQPAFTRSWSDTVTLAAEALTVESSGELLDAVVAGNCTITRFGSVEIASRERLQQATAGLTAVSVRAHDWPAETIASDLGSDLGDFESMPHTLRRQFVFRDEFEAKRANTIAKQWISNILRPSGETFIGFIMLWEKPAPVTTVMLNGTASQQVKQPHFVLLKGRRNDAGEFRITQIIFGDAAQALN